MSYYSKPPVDPREWPCDLCREYIRDLNETYFCTADHCRNSQVCVGCIYECGTCGENFCKTHIHEHSLEDGTHLGYACHECTVRRLNAA